ncbi:hypothetical protein [Victivallis sp. Marseille-Q1083]|uniref:hypothetical protein n=1 Tax=Victivallis sp. Marseille-Q1083 TaxID=2717288 RepID=UPI00158B0625|nr:hypothetical protein [Victivallis sp. Marseille-Q1083]
MKKINIALLVALTLFCIVNSVAVVFLFIQNKESARTLDVLQYYAMAVDSRLLELEKGQATNANNTMAVDSRLLELEKGQATNVKLIKFSFDELDDLMGKLVEIQAEQEKMSNAIWNFGIVPIVSASLESQVHELERRINLLELRQY